MFSLRKFALMTALAALGVMVFSTAALAQTPEAAAATAIGAGSATGVAVITDNIGIVLAVAGAFVALRIGRKMLRMLG